jgi:polyhydroxyalkanoate synthesis regulator phasin
MAERASSRGPLETLLLAGIGALALAGRRTDDVLEELARRMGVDPGELRTALSDALGSSRREASRLGETASDAASRIAEELGVVASETVRELELRVAQLEHRLRLLERDS